MPDSFKKRQKEALRLEKRRDKAARRMHRKEEAARGGDKSESSSQDDSNLLDTEAPKSVTELESDPNQKSLPESTTGSSQGKG